MVQLHVLGAEETSALALASFLLLDDLLGVGAASTACRALARLALRRVRLQALGGANPASALLRLVASSLTDRGAALLELDTSFCRGITVEVLRALPKLPALQVLKLDGCQEVDDEGLLAMAQRCQGLRILSLYWNVKATDKGFAKVLRAQPNESLQSVSFSGCKHLSDETVQRLMSRGANLEILDLTRCPQVSDTGALLVFEHSEKLRVLRLYAMAQLSPAAFAPLKRLVHLEELDLCGCRLEDQQLVEFLAAAAPSRLHTLNLTWCPALTDAAALAVARECPRLDWLSYFGNTNISAAAIEALAAGPCGPRIRYLDMRGLTRAAKYSVDSRALRELFPALVETELHH